MKENKAFFAKASQIKMYICLHVLFLGYSIGGIFSKRAGLAEFLSKEFILNYMVVFWVLMVYAVFWQQILKKLSLMVAMVLPDREFRESELPIDGLLKENEFNIVCLVSAMNE